MTAASDGVEDGWPPAFGCHAAWTKSTAASPGQVSAMVTQIG
jgi:hypothetical protein